jgi:biopolymer transport protein ExbD
LKNFAAIKKRTGAELNITPLIDVIFMLVVFFMIGSTFEKPAFRVRLPEAASRAGTESYPITIAIDREGNIYLDGKSVSPEELSAALTLVAARNPRTEAALDCDAEARFQSAASVMDLVKSAGINRLAVRYNYGRQ